MAKMELNFLDDGSLPGGVVSLRLLSIWLAFEQVEHPMRMTNYGYEIEDYGLPPWAYDELKLSPEWQKKADEYLAVLELDINEGRLIPAKTMRTFPSRKLDPDATLLNFHAVEEWADSYGVSGDLLADLWVDSTFNDNVAGNALEAVKAVYERLRYPHSFEETKEQAAGMDAEQVAVLIQENQRLQKKVNEYSRVPRPENPKDSALLLIARALELYQQDQPERNTQTAFVAALRQGCEGLHGLSERTINGLLSDAKKAIEQARKK